MNIALRRCSRMPRWPSVPGFAPSPIVNSPRHVHAQRHAFLRQSSLTPLKRIGAEKRFASSHRAQPGVLSSSVAETDLGTHNAFPPKASTIQATRADEPSLSSLVQYVKAKASTGAVRRVMTAVEETESGTGKWGDVGVRPDANVYRNAIRSFLKAGRTDLAIELHKLRMKARKDRPSELTADLPLGASVIRAVLRDTKKRKQRTLDSQEVFDEMKRECSLNSQVGNETAVDNEHEAGKKLKVMLSIMSTFLADGDLQRGREALHILQNLPIGDSGATVPVAEFNTAIRYLGKSKSLSSVFSIIDLMRASKVEPNDETFEFLANAAVRQVEFVTGAVSMDGLPEPLKTEVAFVGRSNVGKSSLVNMLCNRKALAYVSGTPGKTQQFNYFLINGRDKELQFYMADLPGVGYAKVPKHVQAAWEDFMHQYFMFRTSLRVVFHLVDGRHGALADDEDLMRQMASSGRRPEEYVIVLTKMDKMDKQRARRSVLDKTKAALVRNGCRADTPIVLTSSASKLGREEMWRYLQAALTGISHVAPKGMQ